MKRLLTEIVQWLLIPSFLFLLVGCRGDLSATPAPTAVTTTSTPRTLDTAVPTSPAQTVNTNTPTSPAQTVNTNMPTSVAAPTGSGYRDASLPITARVDDLLAHMTLDEKIGQMTQIEKNSITPGEVTARAIGSVLSGGDGTSPNNHADTWKNLAQSYERAATKTRLGIPLLLGVDAVHGHGHVDGAVIFPQEIGLGATRDPALVEKIGRATAEEMAATAIRWDFAPVVAVSQDIRWGRTYESYSENTQLVSDLAVAFLKGMQGVNGNADLSNPLTVLATPKHFIGDGGTTWGSSTTSADSHQYMLDQGDTRVDEATLRARFLPPYEAAVKAGAQSIMVSFSSWNGTKMHAQKYLLTDVLKGELGFQGFLISDWGAVDQVSPDYYKAVVTSINAGVDMVMVPYKYQLFTSTLYQAVTRGDVPMARIDDAVRRILTVKFKMGLFENPVPDAAPLSLVGSAEHRALARSAVQKSLVLLKNENHLLPLAKNTPSILVAGRGADDIGMMSGGWTIEWQGALGKIEPGTTILQAIQQTVSPSSQVTFSSDGAFSGTANVGIAVVGEFPYAEGYGDKEKLDLSAADADMIQRVKEHSQKVLVIVISGRPLVVTKQLPLMDGLVAAWLPGTAGQGVADVLFGDAPFTGKLPYTWLRWDSQLPFDFQHLPTTSCAAPLFPYGYGLATADPSPAIPDCPEK